MTDQRIVQWVRDKYIDLADGLDERSRRIWAAVEARSLGYGGISAVVEATGISDRTIRRGLRELQAGDSPSPGRQRRSGGGRKAATVKQPDLAAALEELVEPVTRGDPMTPLRWTCKSTRTLAAELSQQGYAITAPTVGRLLREAGYSLQANRKTREGKDHPDRNAQFEHINRRVQAFQRTGQPAISVDTKKKEVLGNKKNPGQTWRPSGDPVEVDTHDFPDPEKGKAVPYGVYDIGANEALVNVGINHDTAQFAVASIELWWRRLGERRHGTARRLLITADSGGSNGYRNRLWKWELQKLADRTGLKIEVCHFPPGTSKWNKIEHRVFCHITRNWRGQPLESYEVVVQLIGNTKTEAGLEIHTHLDANQYTKGIKVSNDEMETLSIKPHHFHGDWNYTITPRP